MFGEWHAAGDCVLRDYCATVIENIPRGRDECLENGTLLCDCALRDYHATEVENTPRALMSI